MNPSIQDSEVNLIYKLLNPLINRKLKTTVEVELSQFSGHREH